jgi:hypothetical protein
MIKTIMIGSTVSVQGIFVKLLPNKLMQVRVGSKIYTGRPVEMADA